MVGAFLYLTACSLKNRLRRRLRRLREPRYLIGLLVGLAYFYVAFFRGGRRQREIGGAPAAAAAAAAAMGPLQLIGSLFLMVVAAGAWVIPGTGQALAFSRAEVQFFFTAPITRRQLVHVKLWQSQIAILLSSALTALILRPRSLAAAWTLMAGLWIVLVTLRLHLMGVALRRASLAAHGASALARQWLPLAVVIGGAGVLASAVATAWPSLASLPDGASVVAELQRVTADGAPAIVFWPFRALIRLPLAASAGEFLAALPAALGLLALNYAWVIRSDAAFEEAAAAHAEKRATARTAPRAVVRGVAATPFTLAPDGPVETAILWKNLILVGRYVSVRTLLRLLPLVIVFGLVARDAASGGVAAVAGAICLFLAVLAVVMGPQMMRNDLRQDLARLPLLKTWPVRGAALMRGEVLAPTIVVTAVAWIFLLAAASLGGEYGSGTGLASVLQPHRWPLLAAACLLAPAIVLSQVVVQNGLAVLFPAWVAVGASRARGIDAMGQRLFMLAGILLTLVVSLVPGAIAGAVLAVVAYQLTGAVMIVLPALAAALVVAGECWLAIEGFGRVLDRTDPTAVESAEENT
jgi:hypothetical protein